VLAGTAQTAGPDVVSKMGDELVTSNAGASVLTLENFQVLFFKPSESSKAAGEAWWKRIHERTEETRVEERVGDLSEGLTDGGAGMGALIQAFTTAADWEARDQGSYLRLGDVKAPTLVANGYEDIMLPTINSFVLSQRIPKAWLVIYPDAGHGFLFQYVELFARQANKFLDGKWEVSRF
jgi:pimeloyl-ACP methyl ester carboxylesterase